MHNNIINKAKNNKSLSAPMRYDNKVHTRISQNDKIREYTQSLSAR